MSDIEVRGGAGGIAVALDDLGLAAGRLRSLAGDVLDLAATLAALGAHPELAPTVVLAPGETLAVEGEILRLAGPSGLLGEAASLRVLAETVELATDLYRAGESGARHLVERVDRTAGLALGLAVPTVVVPALTTAVLGSAAWRSPPLSPAGTAGFIGQVIGLARAAPVRAGGAVDEALFDHPWLIERAAAGAEGVVVGLGLGLPPAGLYLAWASRRAGVAYPPTTQEGAVAVINAAGGGRLLDESAFDVETTPRPVDTTGWRRPGSVADLVGEDASVSGQGAVRVSGVPLADGRYAWVVDIPGTQTFTPVPGSNPFDQTSNQLLEAGERTLTMTAVTRALSDAKRRAGRGVSGRDDPVMTLGHSQGGITAAALSADPVFRTRHPGISHVTTTGAPIGGIAVPPGVRVLAVEHRQDLVPALDGRRNPAHGDWVTVRRDVPGPPGAEGRASEAHASELYVGTAETVDRSAADDPSLRVWREGAGPFLGGAGGEVDPGRPVVVVDYDVRRVPRGG